MSKADLATADSGRAPCADSGHVARKGEAMSRFLAWLPVHLQWAPHNLLAHPLSELLHLVGLSRLSNWVHDVTIPPHERGEGRG